MNSRRRTVNKPPSDPLDKLIFDRHLYIKGVVISRQYGKMFIMLNKGLLGMVGNVLTFNLADYPLLKGASEKQLNDWRLISRGIGIHWEELDEDLSLRGFIDAYIKEAKQGKMKKGKTPPEIEAVLL
jgi:hypothetical protein